MTARVSRLPAIDPRFVGGVIAVALLVALNVYLFLLTDWSMLRGDPGADWTIFGEAGRRASSGGDLYAVEDAYAFRYSPLLAHAFAALHLIGPLAWRALHVAAVASLAWVDTRLALVTLLAWPFWFDVEAGNLMAFTFVLAAWALAGRGWAIGGFFILGLLVPRPLALPIIVWLLWKHPAWRLPFVGLFIVHAAAVLATGWGPAWVAALAASTAETGSALNFGPSRLIGSIWIPIGLVLAGILTWRGRLGLASLAASPYWLPYYFLMPLLDLRRDPRRG